MANGRITTGFSYPHVAKYSAAGGVISFTGGRPLARGVSVSISPNSSGDNKFYADNVGAETAGGIFTGGEMTLTVDGLFVDAERFVYGLPDANSDGWTGYGDNQKTPDIATGFVTRYMSGGVTTYQPTIIVKGKYNIPETSAETQEEDIDWQTQELTANIMRGDDANHNWKFVGKEYATEQEALRALQLKLGMELTNPEVTAMDENLVVFGTAVADIQSDVQLSGLSVFGTLKYLSEGALVDRWGAGNFIALQFSNLDERATSIKVGLDPSEGDGLVEILTDPDHNGVFKVTNNNTQVFEVVVTDGVHTRTIKYDLSQLTLEAAGA